MYESAISLLRHLLTIPPLTPHDERNFEEEAINFIRTFNPNYKDSESNSRKLLVERRDDRRESTQKSIQKYGVGDRPSMRTLFVAHEKLIVDVQRSPEFIKATGNYRRPMERDRRVDLGLHEIPYPILNWVGMEMSSYKKTPQLKVSNYIERFQENLWFEEAYLTIEMRRFDLFDATLSKSHSYRRDLYEIQVPGLEEGRPSLLSGDKVYLRNKNSRKQVYHGSISEVRKFSILVRLDARLENAPWTLKTKYEVSFLFSRTSFRRCHFGIRRLSTDQLEFVLFPKITNPNNLGLPLIDINHTQLKCFNQNLNEYQRRAVTNVMRAEFRPAPYIIFGPPGTGKTATLVECIVQLFKKRFKSKILVCGSQNSCADHLARLIRATEQIEIDLLMRVAAGYRMESLKDPEAVSLIPSDIKDICSSDSENDFYRRYKNSRVIVTTCSTSGRFYNYSDKFDFIFIDEAGHASEPDVVLTLGLLAKGGSLVLVGDPKQLGPVVFSKFAAKSGLKVSLLERLYRKQMYNRRKDNPEPYNGQYITKLIICYRSDPRVMAPSNQLFYDNELQFKIETPKKWLELLNADSPLIFHAVGGKDVRDNADPSRYNPHEALVVMYYVCKLYKAGLKPDQLGIVTPYRRQRFKLNLLFEICGLKDKKCKIATTEEFQGEEREIIIVTTVRASTGSPISDKNLNLDFLFEEKRFNVTVSRSKSVTIAVGDERILKQRSRCWKTYINQSFKVKGNFTNK